MFKAWRLGESIPNLSFFFLLSFEFLSFGFKREGDKRVLPVSFEGFCESSKVRSFHDGSIHSKHSFLSVKFDVINFYNDMSFVLFHLTPIEFLKKKSLQ